MKWSFFNLIIFGLIGTGVRAESEVSIVITIPQFTVSEKNLDQKMEQLRQLGSKIAFRLTDPDYSYSCESVDLQPMIRQESVSGLSQLMNLGKLTFNGAFIGTGNCRLDSGQVIVGYLVESSINRDPGYNLFTGIPSEIRATGGFIPDYFD